MIIKDYIKNLKHTVFYQDEGRDISYKTESILKEDENYYNGYLSNKKLDIDEEYSQSKITKNDVAKIGEQMTESFGQMIPIMTSV